MAVAKLDDLLPGISDDLLQLPQPKIAAFAASSSERLIGFCEDFARKSEWGSFALVREALDAVWRFLRGETPSAEGLHTALSDVEQVIPRTDDYGIRETILAQDACICVCEAIEWCLGRSEQPDAIVEFSFEALRIARCVAYTGYIALGDDPEAEEFEKLLVRDPIITTECRLQREDLALLRSAHLDTDLISDLQRKAEQNRWSASYVFGVPRLAS
jgi:uncharacterized protein YjaG (DUF416 family)